ncbi:MAG: helix-hairpin-helix domain-containing protein [Candidatus Omnitrophota bacterium]|nr:helix-hairpin-helix domain-containing protein [Candidatus Omnitrophota bacterium]
MFTLTARERKALLFIALVIIVGAAVRYYWIKTKTNAPVSYVERQAAPTTLINVNNAHAEDLEKIPGIGPELARRIIAFRAQNGTFKTLSDLTKIKGIGAKKVKAIEKYIAF